MKVLFKNLINGYTGCVDDLVMYYNRKLNRVLIRQRPVYRNHPAHAPFKAVMANLKALNPSAAYRADLKAYLILYNQLPQNTFRNAVSWNNLWQKMMWMLARINHAVNLQTISKPEIYTLDLPCISVRRAVEAGLLPRVKNYETLTNII
jgi:hypothetical protein